ncbi:recombinase RecT [Salipaludibacillus sp. CF4.18]|uniref:recombinase RecT n=1 Tax=Salipaludibacillus sp. CF4.18 TaxID=3373081 RepID=UPI003EE51ECF
MTEKNEVAVRTSSERFLNNVQTQFSTEAGSPIAFSPYEKQLAQHLFLKLDSVLKDLEAKRVKNGEKKSPYDWHNVNMRKLSLDAVHSVQLGLDALIPNHIHPVPYFNGKEKKYDLDLRVGYVGKAYYRMEAAVDKPKDVILELVHETDKFKPIKKSLGTSTESYEFEITNAFERGKVIGGFGYLVFDDETKNKLILVSKADFDKSKKSAQSQTFWNNHPEKMQFKTLVHRVTEHLKIDPKKVNASYLHMENKDEEESVRREVNENANQEILDVESMPDPEPPKQEKQPEPPKEEPKKNEKEPEQQSLYDSFEETEKALANDKAEGDDPF